MTKIENEQNKRFSKWLERAAYHLCEHCVIDSKGNPCCLHNEDAPAYCLIENCPYVREVP